MFLLLLHDPGTDGIGLFHLVLPSPVVPGVHTFVTTTPQHNAGMVAQSADVIDSLLTDIFEPLALSRIRAAGKHEVLPYHQPHLVAEVVEQIVLIDASTPYTNHVHIGRNSILKRLAVTVWSDLGQEIILWDIVGAFSKHGNPVEHEIELFLAISIRFCYQSYRAQPDAVLLLCYQMPIGHHLCRKSVKLWFAESVAPPKPWVFDDKV